MDDQVCPRPVDGFQVDELDGEAILFHPVRLTIMRLNRTAALIWHLCDGQRTAKQIRDALTDAYPEARRDIEADLPRVLQLFQEHEVLTIEPRQPGAAPHP
ncbi:MAG: PqqD family protein [Chloroflexota bacterium]